MFAGRDNFVVRPDNKVSWHRALNHQVSPRSCGFSVTQLNVSDLEAQLKTNPIYLEAKSDSRTLKLVPATCSEWYRFMAYNPYMKGCERSLGHVFIELGCTGGSAYVIDCSDYPNLLERHVDVIDPASLPEKQ